MKETRNRERRQGDCSGCPQTTGSGKRDDGGGRRGIPLPAAMGILKPRGLCAQAPLCVQGRSGVTPGLPVVFGFRATEAGWGRTSILLLTQRQPSVCLRDCVCVCVRKGLLRSQKSPSGFTVP